MSKRICDGKCKKFKVTKPVKAGRYASGQCHCQICDMWMDYKGCHLADNTPAIPDSGGWYCNCCNYRVRRKHRNIKYKEKLRSSNNTDSSEDESDTVDFSYFNKRRAGMMKTVAGAILTKGMNSSPQDVRNYLEEHYSLRIAEIEHEFDASFDDILGIAYILNPPNKMSMILEFERVKAESNIISTKSELERIKAELNNIPPTKSEFETYSKLTVAMYEIEFQSWENFLDRLGYDPFYRDNNVKRVNQHDHLSSSSTKLEKNQAQTQEELKRHIQHQLKNEPNMLKLFEILDKRITECNVKTLQDIINDLNYR